jgi:hypothetical protein
MTVSFQMFSCSLYICHRSVPSYSLAAGMNIAKEKMNGGERCLDQAFTRPIHFYPEDGGSTYLQNLGNAATSEQCRDIRAKSTPRLNHLDWVCILYLLREYGPGQEKRCPCLSINLIRKIFRSDKYLASYPEGTRRKARGFHVNCQLPFSDFIQNLKCKLS